MKKDSFKEYEKGFLERQKLKKTWIKYEKRKDHTINELAQEKMLLESMNKFLQNNDEISADIFQRMSHELRTPIVTIKANIDMVLAQKFGKIPPEVQKKLVSVAINVEILTATILNLLDKKSYRVDNDL